MKTDCLLINNTISAYTQTIDNYLLNNKIYYNNGYILDLSNDNLINIIIYKKGGSFNMLQKERRVKAGREDLYEVTMRYKEQLEEKIRKQFEQELKEIDDILNTITEEVEVEDVVEEVVETETTEQTEIVGE